VRIRQRMRAGCEYPEPFTSAGSETRSAGSPPIRGSARRPVARFGWMGGSFVPPTFEVPEVYSWSEFHLEPLGPQHNDRDHAAWMSSIVHIRSTPGFSPQEEPNWPVAMTLEENLADLVRHAKDFQERRGFTYSILEGDDVIGCIYIYPGRLPGHDAEISSWVRESHAELDKEVRLALAGWIEEAWPFSNPLYAGSA
jgi:hypothetical protein